MALGGGAMRCPELALMDAVDDYDGCTHDVHEERRAAVLTALHRLEALAEARGAVDARVPCINPKAGAPCFWPLVQGMLIPAEWWCVACVKAQQAQAAYDAAAKELDA